jgi:hypothetical protein
VGIQRLHAGDTLVCDTTFFGASAKNIQDFPNQLKNLRVSLILSGKKIVDTDSLILKETVITICIHGIPVKVETFGENKKLHSFITSEFSKNKIIYKRYFSEDPLKAYQVDTYKLEHRYYFYQMEFRTT